MIIVVDYFSGLGFSFLQERAPFGNWKRFRYINDEMKDEVLIMGSSRASHHYVPQIIEDSLGISCYNCGVDGNGIVMFWGNFQMFIERYAPKMIIYDLSIFDVISDDYTTYLGWLKAYYDRACVKSIFDDIDPLEKYKMCSSLYKWNFKFIQLMTDNIAQFVKTDKGYKPLSGMMNYSPGKDKNIITDDSQIYKCDDLKMCYFERMISICNQKRIKLVFALSPMYGASSSKNYEKVLLLARKYKCPIIDCFADSRFVNNYKYFKDSSHMNSDGAQEYTKYLVGIISSIF